MWYAIMSEDVDNSLLLRAEARAAHLARLQDLVSEGRVLVAGPHPVVDSRDPGAAGFSGSLVVVEFPSLEEARTWAESDPYVAAGVYKNVSVKPFKPVLP